MNIHDDPLLHSLDPEKIKDQFDYRFTVKPSAIRDLPEGTTLVVVPRTPEELQETLNQLSANHTKKMVDAGLIK